MKTLRTLLAACLLLAALLVTASADSVLEQSIIDSCRTHTTINVEEYGLQEAGLSEVFWSLYNSGKLPWNLQRTYSYTYDSETGVTKTFTPLYLDAAEYDYKAYEQAVAEIIAATVHEGMSGWQIALSVHDYLVAHTAYDETYTYYRGYDLLVRKTAVCNGYAEAYMDIMTRLGFECHMTVADSMGDSGHAWNILKLGDHYYHVDATWDDPTSDMEGRVLHTYFLKTDEEMLSEGEEGHFGWKTHLTCTDTTYSDSFWNGVDSQIIYSSADTCYLRTTEDYTGYIQARDSQSGEHTPLHTIEKDYVNVGFGEYAYYLLGLSLWNGRLYFSDAQTVWSMLPDGTDLKVVHEHDLSTGKYIAGSHVADGLLYLALSTHENENSEEVYRLMEEADHTHNYTAERVVASCEEGGTVHYTCTCGITFRGETVAPTGHTFSSGVVIKEPTRKETGIRQFTCTNCGETYDEVIPATGGGGLLDWFSGSDEDTQTQPAETVVEDTVGAEVLPQPDTNTEKGGMSLGQGIVLLILGVILGVVITLLLLIRRHKNSFYENLKEGKVPGQYK